MSKKGNVPDDARTGSKLEQLKARRRNRGGAEAADWGSVDSKRLVDAVASCTRNGWGITLSYTRDGGAYVVNLLVDGHVESEYIRPSEDIDLYLANLAEDAKSVR